MKKLAAFSFIGAVLGVKTVVMIDSKYLYPIAIVLLIMVLIYTPVSYTHLDVYKRQLLMDLIQRKE